MSDACKARHCCCILLLRASLCQKSLPVFSLARVDVIDINFTT